jgi:hypothetical protein
MTMNDLALVPPLPRCASRRRTHRSGAIPTGKPVDSPGTF